ncbi:four helix bundle protein [Candidatus Kapaibacterium sp.]
MKESPILEKSFEFALQIIELYKQLRKRKEYVLSKQLLRSGTSIGANSQEASKAQTKPDFLTKSNIALKEAQETYYWLSLLNKSKLVELDYSEYLKNCDELIKILSSIVKTTKERLGK